MNSKVTSLRKSIGDFMVRHGISGEMEQNLLKEAIHLHLLSALSDAGILRYAVFQGGTALRLCYGGERYSEDLDFVCGKSAPQRLSVEAVPESGFASPSERGRDRVHVAKNHPANFASGGIFSRGRALRREMLAFLRPRPGTPERIQVGSLETAATRSWSPSPADGLAPPSSTP
jgi:Nucleotidyl transferase AbiEii toxin, Type IV TA system